MLDFCRHVTLGCENLFTENGELFCICMNKDIFESKKNYTVFDITSRKKKISELQSTLVIYSFVRKTLFLVVRLFKSRSVGFKQKKIQANEAYFMDLTNRC